jgi:dTDP-4-amino-4,6-dideoxygalactose transaminase
MTSGEGGMVVLNNSKAARICRLLRNQGMESKYQNEIVGFNLRMTDIHAAIGRCQLRKLPKATDKRIANARYLSQRLDTEFIPYIPESFKHVFHQYTIRVKTERDLFSKKLSDLGVGNSVYYPTPVHKLPAFSSSLSLPQTQIATESVLSLPVHPSLSFIPGFCWMLIKVIFLLFVFVWIRAALPRYRYDQLMRLGWKVFLPLSLFLVVGVSFVVALKTF